MGVFLILTGFQLSLADNTVTSPDNSSLTPAVTPAPHVKHHKKKASAKTTAQPTETLTPSVSATVKPMTTTTPTVLNKTTAKPTVVAISSSSVSDSLVADGDQAYAAKDYAKAVMAYKEYVEKHGKTPEIEKKLLVAKFYQGQALEEESRKGLKAEENYIKSDNESHNFMVYGKRHPSREAHLVTLSLAFLTPQLIGGDVGLTFLAHWNVGVGIGLMGIDPRLKYYFDGDNASFFLGVGYASYNLSTSANFGGSGGSGGNSKISISGNFLHFTFGPSFQDKGGLFMEIPFDVGVVNFTYSGLGDSSSSSSSGSYNGPAGTIGFRWGYSI